VSVEAKEAEYEYIRHHGSWDDFVKNLSVIRKLDHKISFNMLHFILNYNSIFECVDYLKGIGFQDNSFVIGPLYTPRYYNILNLPDVMLDKLKDTLKQRLQEKPTGYLKNSYQNLLAYYSSTPWQKDIDLFLQTTKIQDERRNVSCRKVFRKLFVELNA
jgi:MoaA/NifB/PqqE/SkfB family radical SAM enzyme